MTESRNQAGGDPGVRALAVDPDGRGVAWADGGRIHVPSQAGGGATASVLPASASALAFLDDGRLMSWGGGTLRVWRGGSEESRAELADVEALGPGLAAVHVGRGNADSAIELWRAPLPWRLHRLRGRHPYVYGTVVDARFSPRGRRLLATWRWDHDWHSQYEDDRSETVAHVFDAATGAETSRAEGFGLAVSDDGVAAVLRDGVRIGPLAAPGCVADVEGRLAAIGDGAGEVRVVEIATGRERARRKQHAAEVTAVRFVSPALVVSGARDGTVAWLPA